MNSKVTYHQQISYCGKPQCRKCREGKGHGPYWYAYQTVNGHTTRTYIGKNLPPDVQASLAVAPASPVMTGVGDTGGSTPPTGEPIANTVRIFALGQYRLERRNQRQWQTVSEPAWQQQRVRSLLALLVASPERRVSRARVIELLWPGSDAEAGSANLNRTLHALRQLLEGGRSARPAVRTQSRLLRSEGDWLILAGQAQVWLDADAFESQLSSPMPTQGIDDASSREQLLREAAEFYGGDFLPEERRAEWAVPRRQALRRRWIGLLLELADIYIARDAYTSALDVLDQLLATDPSHEAAVRRFIYVLANLKRRVEALRAYNRLTEVLRLEYNTAPSDETRQLYEAVRRGGEIPPYHGIPQAPSIPSTPSLPTVPAQPGEQTTAASAADTETMPAVGATTARDTLADMAAVQFGRSHRKPLVGREFELDTLHAMLLDVEQRAAAQDMPRRSHVLPLDTQRHSQCMILMGEAGIGKTRLAEEMSREALRRGWSVIWSRVYQQESGIPYHLWTEVLRRAISSAGLVPALPRPAALRALRPGNQQNNEVGQLSHAQMGRDYTLATETDVLEQETEADQGRMPYSLQPLSALLPELTSLFPTPAFSSLTPEQEELRLWEAAREVLLAAGKSSPLLIVLDDVQWADVSSGRLLGYIARHIFGQPVLLLATCRDTELPAQHQLRTLIAHMHREHTVTTLTVNPLSSEEIGRLVSDLPETLVRHIQEQAAGNPFFAEELARSTPPTMPGTVAAALDHRMNRLSRPCQQLLENAAVLGGSFEFPTLYGMESGADEDAILDLLEEALQSGVLTEEGTGLRVIYHFWHPLLVSHLYERISAIRRARLHLRAAAIMERTHEERLGEVAATIVHHFVMGGAEAERIAQFAELAGDRAYALSAYAEARRHYQLALESLGLSLPAIAAYSERLRLQENAPVSLSLAARSSFMPKTIVPISNAHLLNLLELLAECTMIRGNFEDARHLYEYILALRREHLDIATAMDMPNGAQDYSEDFLYEMQKEAMLWGEIGWTWRYTGDSARARRCCERGEQVLRASAIEAGPAWARLRMQQGSLFWQEGRYEDARRATQESLAFFASQQKMPPVSRSARSTRIQRTLEGDPVDLGVAHRLLGALADAEGRATEALEHLNAALVIFEQADHKRRIAHVAHDLSYVYIKQGAFEQAHASLRRALNLAERLGDDPLIAVVYSNQGELAASAGDLEEAETWYRRSLTLAEQFNDREYISRWNTRLAAVLREQDRLDEAATCTLKAIALGRAMHNNPCTGSALVALSNQRIAQARNTRNLPIITKRLLTHAAQDARRALALPGLEAETRVKADLALAQIALLLGDHQAPDQIASVIKQAHSYQLILVENQARHLAETL